MRYSERKPSSPLNRFVECFWTLESDEQSMQPERILPDGCERRFLREVGLGPKMLDGLRSLYRIRRDYISHRYTQISVADICY